MYLKAIGIGFYTKPSPTLGSLPAGLNCLPKRSRRSVPVFSEVLLEIHVLILAIQFVKLISQCSVLLHSHCVPSSRSNHTSIHSFCFCRRCNKLGVIHGHFRFLLRFNTESGTASFKADVNLLRHSSHIDSIPEADSDDMLRRSALSNNGVYSSLCRAKASGGHSKARETRNAQFLQKFTRFALIGRGPARPRVCKCPPPRIPLSQSPF